MNIEKALTYEESIKRLELDLESNLKNKDFTFAGYMDIENIKLLLKERAELKPKADKYDKVIEKLEEKIEKTTKRLIMIYARYGASDFEFITLEKEIETYKKILKEME